MSNLTKRKTIRFSPADCARYERIAEGRGSSFGAVVRRLAAGREITPREETKKLEQVRQELRAIGRNLNQLVRYAHSERRRGESIDAAELNAAIEQVRDVLRSLENETRAGGEVQHD